MLRCMNHPDIPATSVVTLSAVTMRAQQHTGLDAYWYCDDCAINVTSALQKATEKANEYIAKMGKKPNEGAEDLPF